FLADDAYPLRRNLMKPFPQKNLSTEHRIFNYRLSRARRCVECAFGILVNKWRVLNGKLELNPENVDFVVMACCILHNIIIIEEGKPPYTSEKMEVLRKDYQKTSAPKPPCKDKRPKDIAKHVRDKFSEYFIKSGSVKFQYTEKLIGATAAKMYEQTGRI